jgi:xylan 1,4-beta-xylosidase
MTGRSCLSVALTLLALTASLSAYAGDVVFREVSYTGDDGGPVVSDTQFRNPVIAGFYPDPSAIRVDDDFYLVTSTFGYFPGLPIFHSRDLVSWRQIGNAIDRAVQIDYGRDELTRGLFAATLTHRDGIFYIANTCFYCDGGNFLITATNPAGPWSDPIWLPFTGIDPSLYVDADGSAWIVNNDVPDGAMRYDGHRAIWLQQYDPVAKAMVGPRTVLVDGGAEPATRPEHVEGPHLFKRGDYHYLTAAEGGTGEQHAQMVWRSRKLIGPFVPSPHNPILTQRDLDATRADPVTSTGHAQFIELKDGSWWAVFLATRPYRGNQYNLGRETFLLPVTWQDDWPVILRRGERVPLVLERPSLPRDPPPPRPTSGAMNWTERFTSRVPGPQWMTIHPPERAWFRTTSDGLRITPSSTALGASGSDGQPAYLAHRVQHHRATLTATLTNVAPAADGLAGLALLQNETHHYVIGIERSRHGASIALYRRKGKDEPADGIRIATAELAAAAKDVSLRFELDGARLDAYYADTEDSWKPLARDLDASLLSADTAGGFIGSTFGPYAVQRRVAHGK